MLVKFAVKAQGKSHIDKGIPCQDTACARLSANNTVGVAIVADGHGGSKYIRSRTGSSLAAAVAEKSLLEFYGSIAGEKAAFFNRKADNEEQKTREIKDALKQLEKSIIYRWRERVKADLADNPLTASEEEAEKCKANNINADDDPENLIVLYGTTLLAAMVCESFWFVIQIGDGLCVVIDSEGNPGMPEELEDDRLGFGRTTSLCDSDAVDNFRESFGCTAVQGITAATDGVADSFEPEKYLRFNKELHGNFAASPESAEEELQEFLPELSKRGSGDDVAIAGIFRMGGKRSMNQ